MQKPKNSKVTQLKNRLKSLYAELQTGRAGVQGKAGMASSFTGKKRNRAAVQKEFDKVAAQLKKTQGGAAATRKAAPALKTSPAKKPAVAKPAATKSNAGFSKAFKEARAKFDAGTGGTTFKFNGKSYSVAKPAELKAAGGEYGPKLTKMLQAKQRSSETQKQVTNKPGSRNQSPRQKMLNRLEREKTTKKAYGSTMKKKTVKRGSGGNMANKPKGVGCAMSGYGRAMKRS